MRSSSKENVSQLRSSRGANRKLMMWKREIKYGVSNFARNIWLSLAAIVVMTITLLTVFVASAATVVLRDTVETTKVQKMDLSLYLNHNTAESVIDDLKTDLEADENVSYVEVIDSVDFADDVAKGTEAEEDDMLMEIYEEGEFSENFPHVVKIHVFDISQIDSITELVNGENSKYRPYISGDLYDYQFFHGENQKTVQSMTDIANTVQLVGFILAGVFLFITVLVIFNTIRLAIFARKDEIEMEKLIGAEKSYVRGPFLVEAELYGIISGILSLIIGYGAIILFIPDVLTGASMGGVETEMLHNLLFKFMPLVIIGYILLGVLIGNLSARLAVKKYLKY